MIDPELLKSLKKRKPFEPFRIHMVDGVVYDVDSPRVFVVMETQLVVHSA